MSYPYFNKGSNKMWYYEDHVRGSIYTSEEPLDWDELDCDRCGGSDIEHGYFETEEEFDEYYAERYYNY